MKTKYISIPVLIIILNILILSGCSGNTGDGNDSPPQDSAETVVPVRVDSIRKETLDVIVPSYGVTSAQQLYKIISPVTGVITRFSFYNGDPVEKGETIALVVTKESYAAIKGAQSLMNNAVTDEQKREAVRTLNIAEQSSNQIKITAPFSGTLVNRSKNENEVVNEGELIASLIDKNSILFVAQVPADSIYRVKVGQPVSIIFPSIHNKMFEGNVKRIEPQVNMESQTFPVQIGINNPAGLLPDSLYGEASIIIGKHKDVFVVPLKAVIHDEENDTYSITLINPDSIAYTVNVRKGIVKDSLEEIYADNIKAGMKVIVEGNYGLPDSTKVSIKK